MQQHIEYKELLSHDATLTVVSLFCVYASLAASDSMKATFLTFWTVRHTKSKILTAMQIPLLHNWMCFSLLVISTAVCLSENRINQLKSKFLNKFHCWFKLLWERLTFMRAKHNQADNRRLSCPYTQHSGKGGGGTEWKSDPSFTRSAHTLQTHAFYSALFFSHSQSKKSELSWNWYEPQCYSIKWRTQSLDKD